jgi:branched-chain amino acid transport system substrate-binding protein
MNFYGLTDPGRYENLTDDFSAQISPSSSGGMSKSSPAFLPPDFTTFWNQAKQQGFPPQGRVHRQGDPVPAGRRGAG